MNYCTFRFERSVGDRFPHVRKTDGHHLPTVAAQIEASALNTALAERRAHVAPLDVDRLLGCAGVLRERLPAEGYDAIVSISALHRGIVWLGRGRGGGGVRH